MTSVLFLIKFKTTALSNSIRGKGENTRAFVIYDFVTPLVEMLRSHGIAADVQSCIDAEYIDRIVRNHKPPATHVVLESYLVSPDKMEVLTRLYPSVTWVLRSHGSLAFLSEESENFIDWNIRCANLSKVVVANSSMLAVEELKSFMKNPVYLPNYLVPSHPRATKHWTRDSMEPLLSRKAVLNIGCFGANPLQQSIGSIQFSRFHGLQMMFHIIAVPSRALDNLRHLFSHLAPQCKLVEHPVMDHNAFLTLLESMDILIQNNLTNSANLLMVDAFTAGVPVIGNTDDPLTQRIESIFDMSVADFKIELEFYYRNLKANCYDAVVRWKEFMGVVPVVEEVALDPVVPVVEEVASVIEEVASVIEEVVEGPCSAGLAEVAVEVPVVCEVEEGPCSAGLAEVAVEVPEVAVEVPEVAVEVPVVAVEVPEVAMEVEEGPCSAGLAVVAVEVPEVAVEVPEVAVEVPEVAVEVPVVAVEVPEIVCEVVCEVPEIVCEVPEVVCEVEEGPCSAGLAVVACEVPEVAVEVVEGPCFAGLAEVAMEVPLDPEVPEVAVEVPEVAVEVAMEVMEGPCSAGLAVVASEVPEDAVGVPEDACEVPVVPCAAGLAEVAVEVPVVAVEVPEVACEVPEVVYVKACVPVAPPRRRGVLRQKVGGGGVKKGVGEADGGGDVDEVGGGGEYGSLVEEEKCRRSEESPDEASVVLSSQRVTGPLRSFALSEVSP
jgi:hypothetical protein